MGRFTTIILLSVLLRLSSALKFPDFDLIVEILSKIPGALNASTTSNASSTATHFALRPTTGTTWNIQLLNVPAPEAANDDAFHVWDFDMEGATKATIDAFHAKGRSVVCYFSAGSWEDFRTDANQFPPAAIGKTMAGWPNEKWIDIRHPGVRDVMKKRIQQAAAKGCDGVDPDNIDGFANDTGFPLTANDSVDYVRFLAQTAHETGLAYGLKNGGDIVEQVVDVAQWCIQEECVFYQECDNYRPFIDQNKPVFHIEYPDDEPKTKLSNFVKESCGDANAKSFSTLVKHRDLGDWTTTCH